MSAATSLVGGSGVVDHSWVGGEWAVTPMVSKTGNPVFSKTLITNKGVRRTIYADYLPTGLKIKSLYELKTGLKPKIAKKPKKKRKVSSGSDLAKARRKFNKRPALNKKIDRSRTARRVVTKFKNYIPDRNDFKGVDTRKS